MSVGRSFCLIRMSLKRNVPRQREYIRARKKNNHNKPPKAVIEHQNAVQYDIQQ